MAPDEMNALIALVAAFLGIGFMYRMLNTSKFATLDEDGLPLRDEHEIAAMFAAMPRQWVEYPGRAPALSLQVRGLSHELYCRVAYKHFARATDDPTPAVVADAYVLDWRGAIFLGGEPMRYSAKVLAAMIGDDPNLGTFIRQQAQFLSSPPPESAATS
jgi:hypothetical protein